jgi:hypothetical protein
MKRSLIKAVIMLVGYGLTLFAITTTFCGCEEKKGHDHDDHYNVRDNDGYNNERYADDNGDSTYHSSDYRQPVVAVTTTVDIINSSPETALVRINGQRVSVPSGTGVLVPYSSDFVEIQVSTAAYALPAYHGEGDVNYRVSISNSGVNGVVDAYISPR